MTTAEHETPSSGVGEQYTSLSGIVKGEPPPPPAIEIVPPAYVTKYYVSADGRYLGGYAGAEPPDGAIEVPNAPSNAAQLFKDGAWIQPAPAPVDAIPMLNLHLVLIEDGHLDNVEATISAIPGDDGKRARAPTGPRR